jgi:PAS domain S-box-containing protein
MQDILDLQRIFHALPGLFLVLRPDAGFSIVGASAEYLQALHADASIFGQPLAALFPRKPQRQGPDALHNLRASLQRVVATRRAETMPVQQFDLQRPAATGAAFEDRFWLPVNSPVLAADGSVELIVHRVHEAAAKANQDAIGILDSITEGFYTLDRQWRFDYVNREANRILGRQAGELAGQVVWQAYPGLEGTEIERRYLRAMHQREKSSFTAYYTGHERWYEITIFPAPEGVAVFFRNVTEQKTLEAQRDTLLAESERQRRIYETALDSTPDFVSVFDLQHRALYANASLRRTWGVDDVRGKGWSELGYPEPLAQRHDRDIDLVIATGAPVRGETPFTGTTGTRLYDYIFSPVLGQHGEVVAVAGTARDITERQQLTERLGESQRLEAIGTLAGGVAHDFNNMLAAILVNMALAEQEIDPTSQALERLRLAHRAAERARSLVRQILTFSRRAPKLQRPLSLQPLVDEAIALLRSTLPPTVTVAVRAAAVPLWASVDGAQFQQMVVNLCTNAWQALNEERGKVRVSLRPLRLAAAQAGALGLAAGDYIRLQVADNGMGMDEAVRTHIFEPFFTTKPLGRGTGLGMAVVHGVVKESGGAIQVHSQPGRGTAIAVYLPRLAEPAAGLAAARPLSRPDSGAQAGRVLYVDDDEIVSLTAEALLARAGFVVDCVADGQAALSALREHPHCYAAMITDYNMPGMSGLALAEAATRQAPGTALIIISGLVTEELQAAASRLGVRQVVFKEHMLERLVGAVRAAVGAEAAAG